jgi:DNA-binding NarL/FixJ family response regulator
LLITTNPDECTSLTEAFTGDNIVVHCINEPADSSVVHELDQHLADKTARPSLIVLDIDAPGGYRISLLARLRQHSFTQNTPVLTFSQNNDSSFVERLYQEGVVSVFKRPADWAVFAQTILKYWSRSEVRLPNESEEDYWSQRRGNAQQLGFSYYPGSQSE